MRKQTVEVFHALMKKGWIDRSENIDVWRYYEDPEIQEELETMKEGMYLGHWDAEQNTKTHVHTFLCNI